MAEDYFPGEDPQSGSTLEGPEGPPKDKSPGDEPEEDSGESALLPKSMIGDAQPGDTITVRVKRIFEEEVEVEPMGKEESAGNPENEMDAAMGEMDRMGKAA